MTRVFGKITAHWHGETHFVEHWKSADGGELTVHQHTPGDRESSEDQTVELAPGVRVREMSTDGDERAVIWTTGNRTFSVHVNAAARHHLADVVVFLRRAAKERPITRGDRSSPS